MGPVLSRRKLEKYLLWEANSLRFRAEMYPDMESPAYNSLIGAATALEHLRENLPRLTTRWARERRIKKEARVSGN